MCDGIRPPKFDKRKNATCIYCKKRKCEDPEDEICEVCWQADIDKANQRRIAKINAGWQVDATGAIRPPNDPDEQRGANT